ncbi:MAG: acetyl-CoA carboxylase, biotin carboxyl carrier protein [Elusimicrobia bacterium RIFOXYA2_FULL_40_6]|nr:MAG: acetyl-CoA carboxylase, biotin carboxyl carrier protein [Elusimicrobia bacterium RIFOXYA2_FULL_40_6]
MDPKKEMIETLYQLALQERLEEIEFKDKDFYVRIKRPGKRIKTVVQQVEVAQVEALAAAAAPATAVEPVYSQTIKSPLNGVFYRAPSPTSPTYVKEGDMVDPGATLCIVEAMKVMNEIKAEKRSKIVKILVENGKPVNSGQDLFVLG